jgi:uncharacterized protein YggE
MDMKPDTVKISASQREEVPASHADLFVTVRGSSLVSGKEAIKKAREVSQLVDELVRLGIPAENVHLQGVHVESSSGTLLKSSSATYRLRIRCEKLDQVPDLLDIIAAQKNATLERIAWKYPEEAARERLLKSAIKTAKAKADKVAAALGVKILGVYQFAENSFDEEAPFPQFQAVAKRALGPAAAAEPSLGMDIQHSKTIQIGVEIEYRVSEINS